MRNIIGQSESSIDLRSIMDEGKILLVNLSKGDLGENNSALLGSVLVNLILIAALRRRGPQYQQGRRRSVSYTHLVTAVVELSELLLA